MMFSCGTSWVGLAHLLLSGWRSVAAEEKACGGPPNKACVDLLKSVENVSEI